MLYKKPVQWVLELVRYRDCVYDDSDGVGAGIDGVNDSDDGYLTDDELRVSDSTQWLVLAAAVHP